MANQSDGANNGSVPLLGLIGKKEDIILLEQIRQNTQAKDPGVKRILTGTIDEAIEAIKNREGINKS